MNFDELLKGMQSLQEEVAKNAAAIEQLGETIDSLNKELSETHKNEEDEIAEVQAKWIKRRTEITKEIADKKQKKQLLENSGRSLSESMSINETLFRLLSESVPKADVKDAIAILEEKYAKSEFESTGPDDLCPDDFQDAREELGIKPEPDSPADTESEEPTAA